MDYLQAAILALLQGLTEWLPVSSSGHLVLAQHLMGLTVPVSFDVLLHLGTLFAVVAFMRRDIVSILSTCLEGDFKMATYVVLGSLPAAAAGLILKKYFEALFSNLAAVALAFFLTGVFLLASRRHVKPRKLDSKSALAVGLIQAVSIVPGISRSGSTIAAGLIMGLKRQEAARFSFLLSMPAVAGAMVVQSKSLMSSGLPATLIVMSVIVSAAVGYASLRFVWSTILKDKFHLFGYYLLALSLVTFGVFLIP